MRRYSISLVCFAAIVVLLLVLLQPWSGGHSPDWPEISEEEITVIEFSGGQNYILNFQKGRWHVSDGVMQSLADQRKVEYLLDYIRRAQPLKELPKNITLPAQSLEADSPFENGTENTVVGLGEGVNGSSESAQSSFGPDISNPDIVMPKSDEYPAEPSILPTSVTLRGNNTWTIAPLVSVDKSGLVSTRVIKNGRSQIVYLDQLFSRQLSHPQRHYADLSLFSARPERVTHIELYSPGGNVWELAKLNEGTFSFIQPERFSGIEVPQAGMEFYLHAILSTQSPGPLFSEAPDDLGESFLVVKTTQDVPNLSTGAEREDESLTISRRKSTGDYVGFSSYQGAYFIISAEKVEQLGRSMLSLRSRPVLPNGIGSVQKAKLVLWNSQGKEQVREFFRSKGGWSELDSAIKLIGVDTVFWRLGTLQTEGRKDDDLPEDITPVISWQFEYDEGKEPLTLTFYASPSESAYHWVRLNGDGAYFPVHFGTINEILGLLPAPPANENGR